MEQRYRAVLEVHRCRSRAVGRAWSCKSPLTRVGCRRAAACPMCMDQPVDHPWTIPSAEPVDRSARFHAPLVHLAPRAPRHPRGLPRPGAGTEEEGRDATAGGAAALFRKFMSIDVSKEGECGAASHWRGGRGCAADAWNNAEGETAMGAMVPVRVSPSPTCADSSFSGSLAVLIRTCLRWPNAASGPGPPHRPHWTLPHGRPDGPYVRSGDRRHLWQPAVASICQVGLCRAQYEIA
jgi:hypothetical protein